MTIKRFHSEAINVHDEIFWTEEAERVSATKENQKAIAPFNRTELSRLERTAKPNLFLSASKLFASLFEAGLLAAEVTITDTSSIELESAVLELRHKTGLPPSTELDEHVLAAAEEAMQFLREIDQASKH